VETRNKLQTLNQLDADMSTWKNISIAQTLNPKP
jgi:hypothetical protein